LVAAFQRTAQHAGGGPWSFCRFMAAPHAARRFPAALYGADRKRRLLPDRPDHADWLGGKERDFDRRIREGSVRTRKATGGCCSGRSEAAPAPDPDDLVRVYPRLRSPVDGERGWFGRAPDYGNGGNRRNARCQRDRNLFHTRHLLYGREMV